MIRAASASCSFQFVISENKRDIARDKIIAATGLLEDYLVGHFLLKG